MIWEVLDEKFVRSVIVPGHKWTEGDRFMLKDVDGGPPTGDYVIAAIKVQTVRLKGGCKGRPFVRVWFCARDTGSWVREINCVPNARVTDD